MHLKSFCFLFCHSVNFLILDCRKCLQKGKNRADLSSVDSRVQLLWFCVARTMSLIFLKFGLLYVIMCQLNDLKVKIPCGMLVVSSKHTCVTNKMMNKSPMGSRIQFIVSCIARICFLSSSSYNFQN